LKTEGFLQSMGRLIFEKIRDMYLEGLRLKIAHLVQEWGWNRAEPLSFSEPSTSLVENRNCCRSILFKLLVCCPWICYQSNCNRKIEYKIKKCSNKLLLSEFLFSLD
jgi:hypothetical protein